MQKKCEKFWAECENESYVIPLLTGSLALPPRGSHCRAPDLEAPDRSLVLCFSLGLGKILLLAQLCRVEGVGQCSVCWRACFAYCLTYLCSTPFLATTLSTGGQVKQNEMLVFKLSNIKAKLKAFNFLRKTVSVNWTIPWLCLLL